MQARPSRKHARLTGYDYSQAGVYFVTICTAERKHLFGQVGISGQMERSELGEIARQELWNIERHRKNVTIHHYVVMPNHVHILLEIHANVGRDTTCRVRLQVERTFGGLNENSLATVIGAYKAAVTRSWRAKTATTSRGPTQPGRDTAIWQSRYHDRIVRDGNDFLRIWQYIDTNPAKWAQDQYYTP